LADGTSKPIKDIRTGDKVTATDPATGLTAGKPVTALHVNQDTDLTDVTITTSSKPRVVAGVAATAAVLTAVVLHTTSHHPFWDQTTNRWVNAAQLTVGHQLRTDDGSTATVGAVDNHTGSTQMRDLTVDDTHTYYVVGGTTPVLVHNCDLADIASNHRTNANNGQGVGARKNIAVARSEIDGEGPRTTIATSAEHVNPGEVSMPATRQFSPPNPSRAFDSEVFLLEDLATRLNPRSTGTIHLYSERPVCESCEDVIGQFKAAFPGININISTGSG
jgi:hypothetical protein